MLCCCCVQGGGIVKGPLMLELGVCPEVSAATSATMIMFTAGSVSVVVCLHPQLTGAAVLLSREWRALDA
jgi:hypothetical protein